MVLENSVKNVRVKIVSDRYDNTAALSGALDPKNAAFQSKGGEVEHEHTEMTAEASLVRKDGKTSIVYSESELSGMEGAKTSISFFDSTPEIVMMDRDGGYMTSFVFEGGKRHICVYNTPIMTFEMGVHTKEVENRLFEKGYIILDYLLEIHGAGAERNRVHISILQ